MGLVSDGIKYDSLLETVAAFPDISIAVAARVVLNSIGQTSLIFAPYGLPSRDLRAIRPTSRYLARHGLRGYHLWLERKKYEERMPDWKIDSACLKPKKSSFYRL
jgi:hypothetical protein